MDQFRLSIFRSLSAINSVYYNPRNTEDLVRPLWTLVVQRLCGELEDFLPSSEFRLYTSSINTEPSTRYVDTNTSIVTVPDKSAKDVIPDFVALLLVYEDKFYDDPKIKKKLLEDMKKHIKPQVLHIKGLYSPFLVEVKRAESRHCDNVEKFTIWFYGLLSVAKKQVTLQADCLFNSPKFANQQQSQATEFDPDEYEDACKPIEDLPEENAAITEKMYEPHDTDMERKEHERISIQEMAFLKTMQQRKERDERAQRRAEKKEIVSKLQKALDDWVDGTKSDYYTEETINTYCTRATRLAKLDGSTSDQARIPSKGVGKLVIEPKDISKANLLQQWTAPMRIGSPVSMAYLKFIQDELKIAVDNLKY
ncbi:hypothetical protein BDQ17DRAFT_1435452 [Cyathus striatus]|nr:hypothetical protein BDQ17DRAFT_1435452 [Cyathus striatus]